MPRPFRFGVNLLEPAPAGEWRAKCRRAEQLGYDVILVPDHLGLPAPFPALVAAADATERPRVGTFVLNAGFWNPALLAREVATADALTGGRLELGLGTGYVQSEHEEAALPYGSPGERVDHLHRTVRELDELLGAETHLPRPVQKPRVPLLIGAKETECCGSPRSTPTSRRSPGRARSREHDGTPGTALGRGARRARRPVPAAGGRPPGARRTQSAHPAGGRHRRPRGRGPSAAGAQPDLTLEGALALPVVLAGPLEEIVERVRTQRERFGFSYFTVLEPCMEAFAPVIESLRGK